MIELTGVSQERLMAATRTIARWTRLSGTPDERAAAEYVAGELRAMGYDVQILTHDAYISLPGEASLRVTAPETREIPCITHSMGLSTAPEGVTADLVYAGRGEPEDYARAGAAGLFALVEGRATPKHALNATRAGVRGLVCISGRHPHEMCCSPIWGNPSESTAGDLPRVILLSVSQTDGEALRELCRRGPVAIRAAAAVRTGWTTTPIVQADLAPGHPDAEGTFVLLSGHLDSWYLGAMDNGSANAAMLEVARLVAGERRALRRGLRVAFWSGHSHGRYSSSAWYADTRWAELDERCVVHVNTDSLGAVDADAFETNSMPETVALATEAVREVAGGALDGKRVGRNSDQSFLGIGIPSILGSVSRQSDGSLGWWWHTPYDTLERIDPARLERDTRIFVRVVWRLLAEPVLPLDYAASAADIARNLETLAAAAGGRLDLSAPVSEARRLEALCGQLAAAARSAGGAAARSVNNGLRQLGRTLIPATYTMAGRHAHDPALDVPFLPRLAGATQLAAMAPGSAEEKLLLVDLTRARGAITAALGRACALVEEARAGAARAAVSYETLGVRPVVNAMGNVTLLGGSILSSGVRAAMAEANGAFVDMEDLLEKSGRAIARMLGAEAALVTSGAFAALAQGAAAIMAGADPASIARLPDTAGLRNEFLIQAAVRYHYDRCVSVAGGRLVEVGDGRGATAEQLAAAIGPRTASILYPARSEGADGVLPLSQVVAIARARGVAVLVDAAAEIFPLERMTGIAGRSGADLVCFGAKYIGSGNSTGILCGKAPLVAAAALHGFIAYETRDNLAFGRGFKLDRQEIVATVAALREWLAADHDARLRIQQERLDVITAALHDVPGVRLERTRRSAWHMLKVIVDESRAGVAAAQVVAALREGEPSVRVRFDDGQIVVVVHSLLDGEDAVVGERLSRALTGAGAGARRAAGDESRV